MRKPGPVLGFQRLDRRLVDRQPSRPTEPTSPTRRDLAHSRVKGRFTPPLENIKNLPREPPTQRWQQLSKEMGKVNIGLVDQEGPTPMLIITHLHGELYQQVIIDKERDVAQR